MKSLKFVVLVITLFSGAAFADDTGSNVKFVLPSDANAQILCPKIEQTNVVPYLQKVFLTPAVSPTTWQNHVKKDQEAYNQLLEAIKGGQVLAIQSAFEHLKALNVNSSRMAQDMLNHHCAAAAFQHYYGRTELNASAMGSVRCPGFQGGADWRYCEGYGE